MMKGWLHETYDLVDRWSKGIRRRRLCRDTGFHAVVCSHGSAYHDVWLRLPRCLLVQRLRNTRQKPSRQATGVQSISHSLAAWGNSSKPKLLCTQFLTIRYLRTACSKSRLISTPKGEARALE